MILTNRRLRDCDAIPWGYGFAYREPHLRAIVVYPIPFNFLVGWGRRVYHCLMEGPKDVRAQKLAAFAQPREDKAFKRGIVEGMRRARNERNKQDDELAARFVTRWNLKPPAVDNAGGWETVEITVEPS